MGFIMKNLINSAELAKIIGSTKASVDTRRCTGELNIPHIKIGRKILYDMADVEVFIESCKVF